MTVPKKNDRRTSRLPSQKARKSRDKSIHSENAQNGAGKTPRFSQPSLVQSYAQPSSASKRLRQDSSQNQNNSESLCEDVGFSFTEENEAVTRRVLQDALDHVEQEIAKLQASRFSHAGASQSHRSRGIRSTAKKALNSATRKKKYRRAKQPKTSERPNASQPPSTGQPPITSPPQATSPSPTTSKPPNMSIQGLNPCDMFGNLDLTQSNEVFAPNHNQFPSPGSVPGHHISGGVQQTTQMNSQSNIAFSYTFPQSIVPSVVTQAGLQNPTAAHNYPTWNSMILSEVKGKSHERVQEVGGGVPATSHVHMATIPPTIGGPTVLLNPTQPQNGFSQHFGQIGLFQSNVGSNIGPGATWRATAAQPGRQALITQGFIMHNPHAVTSATPIGFVQPNYTQSMANDVPQTGITSVIGDKRKDISSGHAKVYSKKVRRKQTVPNFTSYKPATAHGMLRSSQTAKEKEQTGSGIEQKQKPHKKRRIS